MVDAHACWLCYPLRETTSLSSSSLSLHISETEPSKFLKLVLNYSKSLGSPPVAIERLPAQVGIFIVGSLRSANAEV